MDADTMTIKNIEGKMEGRRKMRGGEEKLQDEKNYRY